EFLRYLTVVFYIAHRLTTERPQIDHRQYAPASPEWANSRHRQAFDRCPFYLKKRTSRRAKGMSALGQKRTPRASAGPICLGPRLQPVALAVRAPTHFNHAARRTGGRLVLWTGVLRSPGWRLGA